MIGASGLQDYASGVWNQIVSDVKNAASALETKVRTDASTAVSQVGAGITNAASGAVAPAGNRPFNIPLTNNQLFALGIGALLLVLLVLYLAFGRKR